MAEHGTDAGITPSSAQMKRLLVAALLVAGVVVGCALVESRVPTGPLVTISTRGGECPAGACDYVVLIERDGRVHRIEPDVADMTQVSTDVIAAIDGAIRTTDFEAIRARPFTGECPVNFDGQETIYEFATLSGVERIASCEVDIDAEHPLFVAVAAALGGTPH